MIPPDYGEVDFTLHYPLPRNIFDEAVTFFKNNHIILISSLIGILTISTMLFVHFDQSKKDTNNNIDRAKDVDKIIHETPIKQHLTMRSTRPSTAPVVPPSAAQVG